MVLIQEKKQGKLFDMDFDTEKQGKIFKNDFNSEKNKRNYSKITFIQNKGNYSKMALIQVKTGKFIRNRL